MDQDRFDVLARIVWQNRTRQQLLRQIAVLPALAAISAVLPHANGTEAAGPGQHLQHRKDRQRLKARRRKEHRRSQQRRDNGTGQQHPLQGAAKTCVPLDQVCSFLGDPCCEPMKCSGTAAPLVTTCQLSCLNDTHSDFCEYHLHNPDTHCGTDFGACGSVQCCRPNICKNPGGKCPGGGPCCPHPITTDHFCCKKGEHCAPLGGCASQA